MNLTVEELLKEMYLTEPNNQMLRPVIELLDTMEEDEEWQKEMFSEHDHEVDSLYDDIEKLQEENFHLKKALGKIQTLTEQQLQEIHYAT